MESKWEVGSWSPGNHCVIEWTKLPEPPFHAAKYRKVAEVYEQADVPKLAAAPEMYGSNEAALREIDTIIPALLKPCRLCDKIFDGPRICSVCAECDTQRAIHAARTMQRRLTNLQKKARGEE